MELENEPVEKERRRVENKGDEMVVRRPRWKEVKIKYRTTVEQVTYSKGEEKLRWLKGRKIVIIRGEEREYEWIEI